MNESDIEDRVARLGDRVEYLLAVAEEQEERLDALLTVIDSVSVVLAAARTTGTAG